MTDSNTAIDQHDDQPQPQGVPYSRFKEVNDRLKALQSAQATQEAAWATEAADWQRKIDDARAETRQLELAIMRRTVGAEVGLPLELAERLSGDNEDEVRADAERLVAMLPGLKGRGAGVAPEFAPEQLSDPSWYARNRGRVLNAIGFGRLR